MLRRSVYTYKSVHFVIDTDHIVEINDAMVTNSYLSLKAIKAAIFSDKDFEKYVFKADEGFYHVDDMNIDIVVSGNVTNCEDDISRFILEIKNIDNTVYFQ